MILDAKKAEDKYIQSVHSKNHVNLIKNISSKQFDSRRHKVAAKLNSIYFNEGSSEAAYLAAGSAVEVLFTMILDIIQTSEIFCVLWVKCEYINTCFRVLPYFIVLCHFDSHDCI